MKLKKLFKNIKYKEIKGSKEVEINGICSDSRCVAPGNLFIARKGMLEDGTDYIEEALSAGAVAVVTDMYNPFLKKIPQVIHDEILEIEADIAANYHDFPSKNLFTVGITGTNGKTTTSYLIKHIFEKDQRKCGLLGSVEYIIGNNLIFSTLTTPNSPFLQKYLKEMVVDGCNAVILEVSSHGLEQERVKNIDFDIAVFSNLTQDHLDYHHTIEHYSDAKKKLFDTLKEEATAVVNVDDEWSAKMIETTKAKIITYGIKNRADVLAKNIVFSMDGLEFDVCFLDKQEKFKSSLIGRFNIYNILAAISASLEAKISLKDIKKYVSTYSNVRGRLEKIKTKKDFYVFVDFAHTPDALENVLLTLNEIKKGRIITVFGCGGNRDKDKRPKMAAVCSRFSDISIITSDNPRREDPMEIISDIEKGFSEKDYLIEEDRYLAIEKAIKLAKKDDIVLIAGKGHESTQTFANKTILFDDKKITEKICSKI
jgi:UDP-N-acetylmuramoyl-L-alanyl-D-glutamate--2,6-diaminopimelate ligase